MQMLIFVINSWNVGHLDIIWGAGFDTECFNFDSQNIGSQKVDFGNLDEVRFGFPWRLKEAT